MQMQEAMSKCDPALCEGRRLLDNALLRLPYSQHLHTQTTEKQPAMESQRPKDGLVIFLAVKGITRVSKDNIIPIYVVCKHGICHVKDADVRLAWKSSVWWRYDSLHDKSRWNRYGVSSLRTRIASPRLA